MGQETPPWAEAQAFDVGLRFQTVQGKYPALDDDN
jgi:hypothetical protein